MVSTPRGRPVQGGFTYLMLIWWVAISGLMLAALAENWSHAMRRQREAELVFRAGQIRQAIEGYHKVITPGGTAQWPTQLEDLLDDRRGPTPRRHLRRIWPDPITGDGKWGLIKEGAGIKGVYSNSEAQPLAAPDGVDQYRQWLFVATNG
ncbi:MAG TPA: type II secretion system protein [Aquabacterium sp.]|uniref:type II secretion system protein n=1 Tax=Aquabacterium sp. TaxID=1872578 RepID=UPI002E3075E7|nr:type II secretion system protein [Aquabacterium sp.]HEX5357283.1 type II secretion system protein [Aquabacterium sp.]